jgi:hypothetical protein
LLLQASLETFFGLGLIVGPTIGGLLYQVMCTRISTFICFILLMQMHRTTELRCRFHERNAARSVSKSGVRAMITFVLARAAPNCNREGCVEIGNRLDTLGQRVAYSNIVRHSY